MAVVAGDGAILDWAGATDVGRVRAHNEDSLLADPPLFAVADGMGGHEAGDVASSLAVERLRSLAHDDQAVSVDGVAGELQNVNALLWDAAPGDDTVMGTTAVGLAIVDGGGVPTWLVFNIGDSRAYCSADGGLVQISRDHSYVQELVDAGEIEPAAAARHPQRHVVTRALGVDDEIQADYWLRPLKPGERYLLCSDGLSGEVDDETLSAVLAAGRSAADTVAELIDLALAGGGRDNVTVLVVDVVSVPGWDDATTGGRGETGAPASEVDDLDPELDTAERTLRTVPPGPPPPPLAEPDPVAMLDPEEGERGDGFGEHRPPTGDLIVFVPTVERAPPPAGDPSGPPEISAVPRATPAPTDDPADQAAPTLIEGLPTGLAPGRPDPGDRPPSDRRNRRPDHGTDT